MLKDIPNIILLSGVFISVSVANVQLTTSSIVNGSTIAICNSTVTYTCLIKSYTLMFFLIDDIRVATCAELFCSQFQAMPSNADFTYNTAAGLFNLTFNDIKRKDTGNVIKCSDGTSTNDKEITQNIQDYTVSFKEVSGPTGYEIKIVTGCISNTTNISFVWNMIPENSSNVKVYTGKTKTMPLDTASCLHNHDCGSSESVKRGNKLFITKTERGSNYYIQSEVVFLEANISYSVKTNFQRLYVISEFILGEEQTNSTYVIILIVCGCTATIAVIVAIISYKCRWRLGKNKRDPVENNTKKDIEKVEEEAENEGFPNADTESNRQSNKENPIKEDNDKQHVMNDASLGTKQDTQGSPDPVENNTKHEIEKIEEEGQYGGIQNADTDSTSQSKKENQIKEEIDKQTAMKDASLETKQGTPGSPDPFENNAIEKVENGSKNYEIPNADTKCNRQSSKENQIKDVIDKQLAMSDASLGSKADTPGSPAPAEKNTYNDIGKVKEGKNEGLTNADTDNTSQSNKENPIKEDIDQQLVMNDASLGTKQDTQGSPDPVENNTKNEIENIEDEGQYGGIQNADTDSTSQSKKENQIKEEIDKQTAMEDASLETKQGTPGSPDPFENNAIEKVENGSKNDEIPNADTKSNRQRSKENQIKDVIDKQLAMSDASLGSKADTPGSPAPAEKNTYNDIGKVKEGKNEGLPNEDTDNTCQSNKENPKKEDIDKQLVVNDASLGTKQDTQGSPDPVENNSKNEVENIDEEGQYGGIQNADTDSTSQSKKEYQIKEEIDKQTAMKDASLETKQGTPGSQDPFENNAIEKVENGSKNDEIPNAYTKSNRQSKENQIKDAIDKQHAMSDASLGSKADTPGSTAPAEKNTYNNIGKVEEGKNERLPNEDTDSTSQRKEYPLNAGNNDQSATNDAS